MRSFESPCIAFTNICNQNWIAGCHYLKNLSIALKSLDQPPRLVLVNMDDTPDDSYRTLLPYIDDVLHFPPPRSWTVRARYALQRRVGIKLGGINPMQYLLENSGVNVVFSTKSLGDDFTLPLLIWIPDFQHLHLPQFFTEADRNRRTVRQEAWAQIASRVVLSSNAAFDDLKESMPKQADKARIVHFVAHVNEDGTVQNPAAIANQYHLPERFIYLPNQFWQHKNHMLAIDALALLQDQESPITIVCTGNTYDDRSPTYFNSLLTRIAEVGVHDRIRILGMIPQEHIQPLIRQSIAVLNPSLFEGWSTTVEETKSIGKPILLSDIAVHREQNPPNAIYFDPYKPQALADAMSKQAQTIVHIGN